MILRKEIFLMFRLMTEYGKMKSVLKNHLRDTEKNLKRIKRWQPGISGYLRYAKTNFIF